MKRVRISELVPGMICAEDVYSYNNQRIIPKNTVLDDKMITRLEFYSVLSIYVTDRVVEEAASSGSPLEIGEFSSYSQKVRASEEFKEFEENFVNASNQLAETLKNVVTNNAEIDSAGMIKSITGLLDLCSSPSGVFDMLHNMRQFDDFTYVHSINVALICNVFAQWLHLGQEDKNILTLGALLHDIGKLKVPEEIIRKPGRLTASEYNVIKTHTLQGYNILKGKNIDGRVVECSLMHHERCDGSGYPLGLASASISPYAKMIAIADVYDAMTSARIYRGPICPIHVVNVLETEGFQKYDSRFLLTFLEHIVSTYISNKVTLSNGQEGEIIFLNQNQYSKPVIKTDSGFIDLSKRNDVYIETFV